jgi:transposase-like protein
MQQATKLDSATNYANDAIATNTINANKQNNILLQGLKNLRLSLNDFSLEQFTVTSIEMLMLLERDEYLENMKRDGFKDKGNGTYPRSFKSLSRNQMIINIPRTRYTEWKPLALEILKYNQEQINDLALTLYRKGLTTRDISSVLGEFFGENMSFSQVSNLAEKFNEVRSAWENSKLESHYKVVYMDALYITVKRNDSYAKEPIHVVYGVRNDNKRELLSLFANPTESSTSWAEVLSGMKRRGVETIDLIVADGTPGLEGEVHKYFPGTNFQKCVIHKMRNILNKARPKDKAEIAEDLKYVFDNFDKDSSKEKAEIKLQTFADKWRKSYPDIAKMIENQQMEYYFTYIKFPCDIRRMIYTTNSIESLNKKIRKATKNKQSFEKPDRLLDYIFVIIKDFETANWMKYPVSSFSKMTRKG